MPHPPVEHHSILYAYLHRQLLEPRQRPTVPDHMESRTRMSREDERETLE